MSLAKSFHFEFALKLNLFPSSSSQMDLSNDSYQKDRAHTKSRQKWALQGLFSIASLSYFLAEGCKETISSLNPSLTQINFFQTIFLSNSFTVVPE